MNSEDFLPGIMYIGRSSVYRWPVMNPRSKPPSGWHSSSLRPGDSQSRAAFPRDCFHPHSFICSHCDSHSLAQTNEEEHTMKHCNTLHMHLPKSTAARITGYNSPTQVDSLTRSGPYTYGPGHAFHISFLFLHLVPKAGWLLVYSSFNIVISSIRSFFLSCYFQICFQICFKAQGHQKQLQLKSYEMLPAISSNGLCRDMKHNQTAYFLEICLNSYFI